MQAPQGAPPNFVQKPSIRQAPGGKIVLECQLTADPAPSIEWSLNGKPITSGGRILTSMKKQGNTYLITMEISQVTLQDGGLYQALAKNVRGEATATITLNFDQGETRFRMTRKDVASDPLPRVILFKPFPFISINDTKMMESSKYIEKS